MADKTISINGKAYPVYATVEEADEYFSVIFGNQWADVSEHQKQQLLITATKEIDRKDFQGVKVDEKQPLKFPRIIDGVQTDENVLMIACCELANNIYSDGGKDPVMGNIKSVSMGDSSISFKDNGKTESEDELLLEEYLSDYLLGGVRVLL